MRSKDLNLKLYSALLYEEHDRLHEFKNQQNVRPEPSAVTKPAKQIAFLKLYERCLGPKSLVLPLEILGQDFYHDPCSRSPSSGKMVSNVGPIRNHLTPRNNRYSDRFSDAQRVQAEHLVINQCLATIKISDVLWTV